MTRRAAVRRLIAAILLTTPPNFDFAVAEDIAQDAVIALQALSRDPAAAQPGNLSQISFSEATYLVDRLSRRELESLRDHLDDFALRLPANIAGAIIAKTPRRLSGPSR